MIIWASLVPGESVIYPLDIVTQQFQYSNRRVSKEHTYSVTPLMKMQLLKSSSSALETDLKMSVLTWRQADVSTTSLKERA